MDSDGAAFSHVITHGPAAHTLLFTVHSMDPVVLYSWEWQIVFAYHPKGLWGILSHYYHNDFAFIIWCNSFYSKSHQQNRNDPPDRLQ